MSVCYLSLLYLFLGEGGQDRVMITVLTLSVSFCFLVFITLNDVVMVIFWVVLLKLVVITMITVLVVTCSKLAVKKLVAFIMMTNLPTITSYDSCHNGSRYSCHDSWRSPGIFICVDASIVPPIIVIGVVSEISTLAVATDTFP